MRGAGLVLVWSCAHLDRVAGQVDLADIRVVVFDDHLADSDRRFGDEGVEIVNRRRRSSPWS
jgi:hypothetical protein